MEKLLVKAILEGYYGFSRKKKGVKFYIAKLEDYSHIWMKALNFEPPPPGAVVAEYLKTPEAKSKYAKFIPYDKKTHPKASVPEEIATTAPVVPDEDEEGEGEKIVEDGFLDAKAEEEAAKPKAKGGKAKGKAKAKKAEVEDADEEAPPAQDHGDVL